MARVRAYKSQRGEKLFLYLVVALVLALYLLFVGACEKQPSSAIKEQDEALYKTGQAELKKGDSNAALNAYLKLIDERKDSPQSHLEAGRIYLFSLKDYVSAIYHFRKFIEIQSALDPSSNLIPNVKQMIETAQKRMITSLPQSPYEDNEGLETALALAKQENYELKQAIVAHTSTIRSLEDKLSRATSSTQVSQARQVQPSQASQGRQTTTSQASQVAQPTSNNRRIARSVGELQPMVQRDVPATYTVKAGDTLSSISNKVYGTTARWSEIFRYNSSTLPSPEKLKVGQVLKLPR